MSDLIDRAALWREVQKRRAQAERDHLSDDVATLNIVLGLIHDARPADDSLDAALAAAEAALSEGWDIHMSREFGKWQASAVGPKPDYKEVFNTAADDGWFWHPTAVAALRALAAKLGEGEG